MRPPVGRGPPNHAQTARNLKGPFVTIQRLVEDGVRFTPAELFTALGKLIPEGRVERRTGLGLWLNSGCNEVYGNEPEEPLTRRAQKMRWGPGWLG